MASISSSCYILSNSK